MAQMCVKLNKGYYFYPNTIRYIFPSVCRWNCWPSVLRFVFQNIDVSQRITSGKTYASLQYIRYYQIDKELKVDTNIRFAISFQVYVAVNFKNKPYTLLKIYQYFIRVCSYQHAKPLFSCIWIVKYFWHFCWLPYLYTFSLYENASFIIVSAETEYISTRSWYPVLL
jgi:hypothetical protein